MLFVLKKQICLKKDKFLNERDFSQIKGNSEVIIAIIKWIYVAWNEETDLKAPKIEPNLMCKIGMNFYQYWHQLVHF